MVLNVPVGSSVDDIKKAYRTLIASWHPDRFASATANEQQQAHARAHEINSAYVALRNHYDFR
jgi:molecular chaperone HscB